MQFDKIINKSPVFKILAVIIGSLFYGLALGLFFAPNDIAPGGIGGISVMLSTFIPLGVGTLTMILNLPLLIISAIKWGWRFFLSTILSIIVSGITADCCIFLYPITQNRLLAALSGGIILGFGCGIVFRAGSTTGGTDIITRFFKQRFPHIKMNIILLIIDGLIALTAGFVFNNADTALYSLLAIGVSSKVIDIILYGADSARMIFIISNKSEEIRKCLISQMNVGCTIFKGISGYEKADKEILLCAMRKPLLPTVKSAVIEIDSKAFLLVTNAAEVFGEGFKTDNSGFY